MKRFFKFLSKSYLGLLCLASLALGIVTLAGFLGESYKICEQLSHFRFVYALVFIPLLAMLYWGRMWKVLAAMAVLFCINAYPILDLYIPARTAALPADAQRVTIMQANLWGVRNTKYATVVKSVRDANADVVGFSEITKTWERELNKGLPEYPYRMVETRFGGIGIYSKYPLADARILYTGTIHRPRVRANVVLPKGRLALILAHPVTPQGKYLIRNADLKTIGEEAGTTGGAVVVFGDLNCSPFSPYFSRLMSDGKLHDTEKGFGMQPTWTTTSWPFVTIDHCLVNDRLVALQRTTGPFNGSDHLPVVVKLGLLP